MRSSRPRVPPDRRVSPGDRAGRPLRGGGRSTRDPEDPPGVAERPAPTGRDLRPDRGLLVTTRAGVVDSVLGFLGAQLAVGLGVYALGEGPEAIAALRPRGCRGAGGERPDAGPERASAPYRAEFLRRDPRDRGRGPQYAPALPRQHAPRPAEPRPGLPPRALDVLHAIRADRPGLRGPRHGSIGAGARVASSASGRARCRLCPAGQRWTFYEIDPAVARIARDPRFFTYLRDCRAESLDVVLGDARLRLREAPEHAFGLIVLDAFSSDSCRSTCCSREAIRLYRSKLARAACWPSTSRTAISISTPDGPAGRRCRPRLPDPPRRRRQRPKNARPASSRRSGRSWRQRGRPGHPGLRPPMARAAYRHG